MKVSVLVPEPGSTTKLRRLKDSPVNGTSSTVFRLMSDL